MEFPMPQTAGRQRNITTVKADPNSGLAARPTGQEAQSLVTQKPDYINNWLGNINRARQIKTAQSQAKAGLVSGKAITRGKSNGKRLKPI